MRYLSLSEVLELHDRLLVSSGGAAGVRDLAALESAVAQQHATFGGQDLYPDLIAKAAALCFSLVMNHPFVDGNKRSGPLAFWMRTRYPPSLKLWRTRWGFRRQKDTGTAEPKQ